MLSRALNVIIEYSWHTSSKVNVANAPCNSMEWSYQRRNMRQCTILINSQFGASWHIFQCTDAVPEPYRPIRDVHITAVASRGARPSFHPRTPRGRSDGLPDRKHCACCLSPGAPIYHRLSTHVADDRDSARGPQPRSQADRVVARGRTAVAVKRCNISGRQELRRRCGSHCLS